MSKSKSYPCKHPETARQELKGIPPAFKCKKCGREVIIEVASDGS